jgi:hypothetical protein
MPYQCAFYDKCEDECPDVCEDICIAGTWQRGLCVSAPFAVGAPAAASSMWLFVFSVCNCTGRVITCFNLSARLAWFQESTGTFQTLDDIDDDAEVFVKSSVGSANAAFKGYGFLRNLLTSTIRLPVGCSTYTVFIKGSVAGDPSAYESWDSATLRPVIINARGNVICASGACKVFEKTHILKGECLPTDTDAVAPPTESSPP